MSSRKKSLVYGVFPNGPADPMDGWLIFFRKDEAERYAALWHALKTANTWAEFCRLSARTLQRGDGSVRREKRRQA